MTEPRPSCTVEHKSTALHAWQVPTQQAAFRLLLEAFSYPGRRIELNTEGDALVLVLATLLDGGVTFADPQGLISADDKRRLGAIAVSPEQAQYVVLSGDHVADFKPALGTLESPEQGATLILKVDSLGSDGCLRLSGPGIQSECSLAVGGIDPAWWARRAGWNGTFPLGIDLILVAGNQVVALPRTTRIQGAD
ncbi:MAG: phosphonate C-P lyase system protein PhnH [Gammaproteobacteria bacterium HGW-Gammaproteobacteria-9]|nr:MAG: phosphonate C-P lyase system protein PhnH [Gammaproteobacteria bacterium HGW-Gammaproteobacteria-9]